MRRPRLNILSRAGLIVLPALVAIVIVTRSTQREEAQIRTRYLQMRAALSAGDTNTVQSLLAPQHRNRLRQVYKRLDSFAGELGADSSILISAEKATIWPVRGTSFLIIPRGNTVEMVKVDGDWFFTGDIHID